MRVEHCDASGGLTEMRSQHLILVEPGFAGFFLFTSISPTLKKPEKCAFTCTVYFSLITIIIIISEMRGLLPSAFAGWRVRCPISALLCVRLCASACV